MKTTIDISDALFERGQWLARKEHVTMRSLVEEGLRNVISSHEARKKPFKLRTVKCVGGGFQPGINENDWDRIREMTYEGRGA